MARYSNGFVLDDSGVIEGTYVNASIVVDRKGIIVSATDGTGGGGGGSNTLEDLTDTIISAPATEQFLRWNGAVWVNETVGLEGLSDVNLSSPQSGEVLSYDGAQWSNFDLSTAGILTTPDIGVNVQAWDAGLDTIAAFDAVPGFVALTAADTFEKRTIDAAIDGGMDVVNGDGVAGNVELSIDINNAVLETVLEGADQILFYDNSAGALRRATVTSLIASGGGVTNGQNLGAGAGVFSIVTSGVMEFRGIDSSNSGIDISADAGTIYVGVIAPLNTIGQLPTTVGNFIVANGADWEAQNGSVARDSLGLGTMAVEDAADFLLLAGGTMAGELNMGTTNKIVGMADPTNVLDAANKQYVDAQVSAGTVAGAGLTKSGSTIDIENNDGTITVLADEIQLNQTFVDTLYIPRAKLESSVAAAGEGASNIGTPQKAELGNATDVEEALTYINDNFATQKFQTPLMFWNLDVGAPNVNATPVRDVEVARFEPTFDTAIYVDFMLPPTFDGTSTFTFYANWAKASADVGTIAVELAYQNQRPGANFPARGVGPNWDWAVVSGGGIIVDTITTNDNLVHTLSWTIPADMLPLDTMSLRLTRLGAQPEDTFALQADFFSGFIIEN